MGLQTLENTLLTNEEKALPPLGKCNYRLNGKLFRAGDLAGLGALLAFAVLMAWRISLGNLSACDFVECGDYGSCEVFNQTDEKPAGNAQCVCTGGFDGQHCEWPVLFTLQILHGAGDLVLSNHTGFIGGYIRSDRWCNGAPVYEGWVTSRANDGHMQAIGGSRSSNPTKAYERLRKFRQSPTAQCQLGYTSVPWALARPVFLYKRQDQDGQQSWAVGWMGKHLNSSVPDCDNEHAVFVSGSTCQDHPSDHKCFRTWLECGVIDETYPFGPAVDGYCNVNKLHHKAPKYDGKYNHTLGLRQWEPVWLTVRAWPVGAEGTFIAG